MIYAPSTGTPALAGGSLAIQSVVMHIATSPMSVIFGKPVMVSQWCTIVHLSTAFHCRNLCAPQCAGTVVVRCPGEWGLGGGHHLATVPRDRLPLGGGKNMGWLLYWWLMCGALVLPLLHP